MISDPHRQPFKKRKFLTQERNLGERIIQWFADVLAPLERKVFERMKNAIEKENITLCVCNGDMVESSCTERGLYTEEDLEVAKEEAGKLKEELGVDYLELNMGNHESGYNLPLSTDPEAGISMASIENFLLLSGRKKLYYSFAMDGYKVIFVPYLFSEEGAKDFDLGEMKKRFLDEFEADFLSGDNPVILFVHDPDSFDDERLLGIITSSKERIKFIFFGHYHSELNLFVAKMLIRIYTKCWLFPVRWIVNLMVWLAFGRKKQKVHAISQYFKKRRNIPKIIKSLNAVLIPAPNGMFGIGGGFLVFDTETGKIRKMS